MRAPLSWIREMVPIPADQDGRAVAAKLIAAGLEVETVETLGQGVIGPLVVGKVRQIEELTEFKKPIRFCQVDVGPEFGGVRGIICGARNFSVGDIVVVALPGTELPGGFRIAARETYGHISDGMICSERELALGDDHGGIMVLDLSDDAIGADAKPVLGVGEEVLDIAVTADRGYALSIRGIAREVATAYSVPFDDPGTRLADLPAPSADAVPWECGSDDLAACDMFTLRTITGFNPDAPSPIWMQRRLAACGMRSVSLAVDVTNYVMLELGQPLHAFDRSLLQGPVRASRPEPGTVLETIDHIERVLVADDLVIRDDRGPISLAGVMGGASSEINDDTTEIVLEAAHFSPTVVARSSRRHKLSSEASRRYERGVDRVLAPYASARAAALLLELGGGTYLGMTAVEAAHEPTTITMSVSLPERTAGMPITAETVERALLAVGCEFVREGDVLTVVPPTWRPDLTDPADLVEEVLRLVGYDELPSTLPQANAGYGRTARQREVRRIGTALAGAGAVEVLCYPFIGENELDGLRIEKGDSRRNTVRLANPLREEQPYLRTTLLPGLAAAVRRNLGRGHNDVQIFEIGSVSQWDARNHEVPRPSLEQRPTDGELVALNAALPNQPRSLAMLATGEASATGWWGKGRPFDWSDAVEFARLAADAVGVSVSVNAGTDAPFHPGRCAQICVDGEVIGYAGELHPRVTTALELPPRTVAAELNLDALLRHAREERPAPNVPTAPVAKEDVALLVDASVPSEAVAQALREGGGEFLESVRLFDRYAGSQVEDGKVSLAFALRMRSPEKTLTAEEIQSIRTNALANAERLTGATLRA